MPFSTFSANLLLDCFLRGGSITPPARVYVSLHTADPGNTGANEVLTSVWPGYARQDAAAGGAVATGFTAASAKAAENTGVLLFPEHDGSAAITISHLAIWDAATGGNCLMSGALTAPRALLPTYQLAILAGDLDCLVA
jgi:hypothetical protein